MSKTSNGCLDIDKLKEELENILREASNKLGDFSEKVSSELNNPKTYPVMSELSLTSSEAGMQLAETLERVKKIKTLHLA